MKIFYEKANKEILEECNQFIQNYRDSFADYYDMTEKLYNEVNEIVSEINNFLNEESSDERKQI